MLERDCIPFRNANNLKVPKESKQCLETFKGLDTFQNINESLILELETNLTAPPKVYKKEKRM